MSRVLRLAVVLGAAVVALRRSVAARLRRPRPGPVVLVELAPAPPPGRGLQAARGVLIGVGVALLLTGAVFEVTVSKPTQVPGLLVWFAAAVVLHDAVLSPLVLAANLALRRAGRRLPAAVLAVLQVAVVVGVVLTLIAVPAIRAKQLGPRNPSVLVGDYGLALVLVWVVLAVLTAGICALLLRRAYRASPAGRASTAAIASAGSAGGGA